MKILGALLELLAKQNYQSSPFSSKLGQIGQIGSAPKRLPRFWVFQLPWGLNSSYVKSIATFALTFLGYIISVLASASKVLQIIQIEQKTQKKVKTGINR